MTAARQPTAFDILREVDPTNPGLDALPSAARGMNVVPHDDLAGADGFRPLSLEDLYGLDLPDPEWLVDGILPVGSLALLAAREKAGKGLLTIDLCASVASGEPFLDLAVMEGPAIYCATEENLRDVRARILARIGTDPRYPFYVLPLNGQAARDGMPEDRFKLEDGSALKRLAGMIATYKPLVVVLDTLREIHDGAEDKSDDMGWRLRPLRELAHGTNTTILVNHHMSKNGQFRGSTAIRAACDLEWAFSRADDGGDDLTGSLRVEGRHGPRQTQTIRFEPTTARWLPTVMISNTDTTLRGRIISTLAECAEPMTAQSIAEALPGVRLKTIQNELSHMNRETPLPFVMGDPATRGNPRQYRTLYPRLPGIELTTPSYYSPDPEPLGNREGRNDRSCLPNRSGNDPGTIVIDGTAGRDRHTE